MATVDAAADAMQSVKDKTKALVEEVEGWGSNQKEKVKQKVEDVEGWGHHQRLRIKRSTGKIKRKTLRGLADFGHGIEVGAKAIYGDTLDPKYK